MWTTMGTSWAQAWWSWPNQSSSSTPIAVTTSGGLTCACAATAMTPTYSPLRAAVAARLAKVRRLSDEPVRAYLSQVVSFGCRSLYFGSWAEGSYVCFVEGLLSVVPVRPTYRWLQIFRDLFRHKGVQRSWSSVKQRAGPALVLWKILRVIMPAWCVLWMRCGGMAM